MFHTNKFQTIEELKTEIEQIRIDVESSDQHSKLVEERLTSEAYLTAEMQKLLDLNKNLSTKNDQGMGEIYLYFWVSGFVSMMLQFWLVPTWFHLWKVIKELEVEKDQMKELIQIHLDYEDELEERWSEIISNVEGT